MSIIGYCDFNGKQLNNQIETANILKINELILRYVDDLNIIDLDDNLIKTINKSLKDSKKTIYALDPQISNYDLYDIDTYEEVLSMYEEIFVIANKVKVNNVIFRLPIIKDILDEFKSVQKQIDRLIETAKKYRVTLLIKQSEEKTNTLVYILKKYKRRDLSLIFDPSQTLINGESPIVAYRLLKEFFDIMIASDIDKKNNPELLGYGRVKVIDLFKRMTRDIYKGQFIIDNRFASFIEVKEEKKVPWYKKPFVKSNNIDSYLRGYSFRIFPKEEQRDVSIFDIYENQMNVLKVTFKLKD